jgi:hypothetical protein
MPQQNPQELKEKILTTLRRRGPSLPVHVAKEAGLSILFASAFLSELASEKEIKISNMKVGGSPLYYLPSHAPQIERYSQHLKSKEKDAFLLLKENKFLKDSVQDPAIRVALRSIKDFAIPLEKNNSLYWRYFTVSESEFQVEQIQEEIKPVEEPKLVIVEEAEIKEAEPELEEGKKEEVPEETEIIMIESDIKEETKESEKPSESKKHKQQKGVEIFDKKEKKIKQQKKSTKKKPPKHNEKFFDKIKEFLEKKSIDISGIEGFNKSELMLRIKEGKTEKLLIAFNKKRITEEDIIKAAKKASDLDMPYVILSLGELSKKISGFIDALKNLSSMEKIE